LVPPPRRDRKKTIPLHLPFGEERGKRSGGTSAGSGHKPLPDPKPKKKGKEKPSEHLAAGAGGKGKKKRKKFMKTPPLLKRVPT